MFHRFRPPWMLLAGVLTAVTLVAFAPGDAPEAKATLGPVQAVTLTAADFHPRRDVTSYFNGGYYLESNGFQMARIPFPAETVVLTSVKVRVRDNHAEALCVTAYRAIPAEGTEDDLGGACTSGASTTDPRTLSLSVFKRVGRYHAAYLWAGFGAKDSDLQLYGATVFYRVVS